MFNRADFVSDYDWKRFLKFSENLETPNIVINLHQIKQNFIKLQDSFPFAYIYYAIKSNPGDPVLKLLAELGSNFDVASIYELDKILSFNVHPDKLSYGNTIKKAKDIKYFYDKGVRMFATDSKDDLKNNWYLLLLFMVLVIMLFIQLIKSLKIYLEFLVEQ